MSKIESAEMFRERLDGEIHYDVRTDSQRLGDDVVSLVQRRDAAVRQDARNGWVQLANYLRLRDRFDSKYYALQDAEARIAQLERERDKVQDTVLQQHRRAEAAEALVAELRAALQLVQQELDDVEKDGSEIAFSDAERDIIRAALARTPAEAPSPARHQNTTQVVDAAS